MSESNYAVLITACILLILYITYTGCIYCYFLLKFLSGIRQKIAIKGNVIMLQDWYDTLSCDLCSLPLPTSLYVTLSLSYTCYVYHVSDKYVPQVRTIRHFFQQLLPNEYKVSLPANWQATLFIHQEMTVNIMMLWPDSCIIYISYIQHHHHHHNSSPSYLPPLITYMFIIASVYPHSLPIQVIRGTWYVHVLSCGEEQHRYD